MRYWFVALTALAMSGSNEALAQPKQATNRSAPVKLSAVINAFLADSGVLTRGLPWSTGSKLPVKWKSVGPVTNTDPNARRQGITLARVGTFIGTAGDSVALPMAIYLNGSTVGLSGVTISIESMEVSTKGGGGYFVTREMVEQALKNDGLTLTPLKCSREKEGASYGNLIDAVKTPGKTASGLWWYWDSPMQRMSLSLSLLYRKADMAKVECQP
jgi:hypothetical protein